MKLTFGIGTPDAVRGIRFFVALLHLCLQCRLQCVEKQFFDRFRSRTEIHGSGDVISIAQRPAEDRRIDKVLFKIRSMLCDKKVVVLNDAGLFTTTTRNELVSPFLARNWLQLGTHRGDGLRQLTDVLNGHVADRDRSRDKTLLQKDHHAHGAFVVDALQVSNIRQLGSHQIGNLVPADQAEQEIDVSHHAFDAGHIN